MPPSSAKKTHPAFTYAGDNWLQSITAGGGVGGEMVLGVLLENEGSKVKYEAAVHCCGDEESPVFGMHKTVVVCLLKEP